MWAVRSVGNSSYRVVPPGVVRLVVLGCRAGLHSRSVEIDAVELRSLHPGHGGVFALWMVILSTWFIRTPSWLLT